MAAHNPKKLIIENNRAVVGKFPAVNFVDSADEERWQCRWVRTSTDKWPGCEHEAESEGYTPVDPLEVNMNRFTSNEGSVVRFSEYVLMKCSKEEYKARQLETVKHSIALQSQVEERLPQLGVKPQHVVPMASQ